MFTALSNHIKKIRSREINKRLFTDLLMEETDSSYEDAELTNDNKTLPVIESALVKNIIKNPNKYLSDLNIDYKQLEFMPYVTENSVIVGEDIGIIDNKKRIL